MTVTGVDDAIDDGDFRYTIVTGAPATRTIRPTPASTPPTWRSPTGYDAAGIAVSPTTGLFRPPRPAARPPSPSSSTPAPTADVTIPLSLPPPTEGDRSPQRSLTFTPDNWNAPQTVTVTGVDDAIVDGPPPTLVTGVAASADPLFSDKNASDVAVTNETPGVTVTPTRAYTSQTGGTATFTIALTARPTADVTIPISSSDPGKGTVSVPA